MKYSVTASGEEWSPAFEQTLADLNRVVLKAGEPVEGNACYWDQDLKRPDQRPDGRILKRRQALAGAAAKAPRVLEVGFNAGHGALLMLAANPGLEYLGVDIGRHAYTAPAATFLRDATGRCKVVMGDSARVLPVLAVEDVEPFDLVHVDGAHDLPSAVADLLNARSLMQPDGLLIVDDMHLPGPKKAAEAMLGGGWFTGSIGEHVAELRLP